jgi:hypothetical protein
MVLTGAVLLMASCQHSESPKVASTEGPRIRVRETEHRGQSVEGHLRHDFVIESTGTESLTITDVVSSCGCTVASPSKKEITPGDSAVVTVDLHVEPSRRESSVFVRSTDPVTPVVELRIAATDMPDRLIQFVPAIIRVKRTGDTTEVQSVLKVEQWKKGPTNFKFDDFKFELSSGVVSIEPSVFGNAGASPIVWEELPVKKSDSRITVELLDRTITLMPVRLRLDATRTMTSGREFVRVDIPSSNDKLASSILAIELTPQ